MYIHGSNKTLHRVQFYTYLGFTPLSASETDLEINVPTPTIFGETPLLGIKQLLRLSELVASHSVDHQPNKKLSNINLDDPDLKKTENSPKSRRRALSTSNSPNSQVSQQNSRRSKRK